jgi:molecular chaperone DnaK (HSP70)
MAWFDPRIGEAENILNAEGQTKTPSLVYFGEDETLVGEPVENLIQDVSTDRGIAMRFSDARSRASSGICSLHRGSRSPVDASFGRWT